MRQLVSRKFSAWLERMEKAHLVLLGTEDGGEIVGHVDEVPVDAPCEEMRVELFATACYTVTRPALCTYAGALAVATLLSATDTSGTYHQPSATDSTSHTWRLPSSPPQNIISFLFAHSTHGSYSYRTVPASVQHCCRLGMALMHGPKFTRRLVSSTTDKRLKL